MQTVVGEAGGAVGEVDGAAEGEAEGWQQVAHRCVVGVCVDAYVEAPLCREADCGGKYPAGAAVGGHAVEGEVGRVRQPCTVAAGVGWLRCVHEAECACGVAVDLHYVAPAARYVGLGGFCAGVWACPL